MKENLRNTNEGIEEKPKNTRINSANSRTLKKNCFLYINWLTLAKKHMKTMAQNYQQMIMVNYD